LIFGSARSWSIEGRDSPIRRPRESVIHGVGVKIGARDHSGSVDRLVYRSLAATCSRARNVFNGTAEIRSDSSDWSAWRCRPHHKQRFNHVADGAVPLRKNEQSGGRFPHSDSLAKVKRHRFSVVSDQNAFLLVRNFQQWRPSHRKCRWLVLEQADLPRYRDLQARPPGSGRSRALRSRRPPTRLKTGEEVRICPA